MNSGRPNHVEEDAAEAPEIRSRREAARRDENEISAGAQQCGGHRHEESVDIGLTVNRIGRSDGVRVGLADLEPGRIGDDDIEFIDVRPEGERPAPRAKRSGMRQDEIRRFDAERERDAAAATPVGESAKNGLQRRDRVPVDLVSDYVDPFRLQGAGGERLDGRATENAGPGGRIEDPERLSARLDAPGHEIGDGDWSQKEALLLAVSFGFAGGAPFADAIGVDCRSFAFPRDRRGRGAGSRTLFRRFLNRHRHSRACAPSCRLVLTAPEAGRERRHIRGRMSTAGDLSGAAATEPVRVTPPSFRCKAGG